MPEHPVDVVSQVTADHRAVEALFSDLESRRGDADEVLRVIVRELSLHAGVEELVLYPVVEDRLPDGHAINETDLAQHQELKEVLVELDGADPDAPATARSLEQAKQLVMQHVRHEETAVLPRFVDVVGADERAELGDLFLKAKLKAPTHPHPHAPNRPPLNAVADAVAAVVDRARDAVHHAMKR
jgi:hypothetical protein